MSDAESPRTADDDDRAKVERLLHEQTHGTDESEGADAEPAGEASEQPGRP